MLLGSLQIRKGVLFPVADWPDAAGPGPDCRAGLMREGLHAEASPTRSPRCEPPRPPSDYPNKSLVYLEIEPPLAHGQSFFLGHAALAGPELDALSLLFGGGAESVRAGLDGSPELGRPEPSSQAAHGAPVQWRLRYLRPAPVAWHSTFDSRKYTARQPVKQLGSVAVGPPKTLLAAKGANTKLLSALAATECAVPAGCPVPADTSYVHTSAPVAPGSRPRRRSPRAAWTPSPSPRGGAGKGSCCPWRSICCRPRCTRLRLQPPPPASPWCCRVLRRESRPSAPQARSRSDPIHCPPHRGPCCSRSTDPETA